MSFTISRFPDVMTLHWESTELMSVPCAHNLRVADAIPAANRNFVFMCFFQHRLPPISLRVP